MAVKESSSNVKEIRWQPHKHCPVCDNAMGLNQEYCSSKCEKLVEEYKEKQKQKNKRLYTILLPISLVVVILLVIFTG